MSVTLLERYRTAIGVLESLPTDVSVLHGVDEKDVLELTRLHTHAARLLGAAGAALAGELAYRSRPELGSGGLARRTGHRTVENLLKSTTGATKEQVLTVVNAGTLLVGVADEGRVDAVTGEVREASQPWLHPVAEALTGGAISVAVSNAISRGLGQPNSAVTATQLEVAATILVASAIAGMDADRLWREARDARDELDLVGVQVREEETRALRALTHHALPAGGGVATWRMDTETYALFVDVYDRMTSPKRGGVRFVNPVKAAKAQEIADDVRDYRQLASDGFIHLIRLGADADPGVMLGSGAPIIRVTVAADALETGIGVARIDGQSQPVSIQTVERLMEGGRTIRVGFDPTGTYLEVGDDPLAENRLYNRRQREILAAKFGGCMDPDCDRPPAWCEAHHIQFVARDGGTTVIGNGILLCKHHHLKYHNDGYEIRQDQAGAYWKIPPTSIDPDQTPILMPLKSRNLKDLQTAHQHARTRAGDRAAS